jgi:CPA2 family monovalent cation:H+ antiporter-2
MLDAEKIPYVAIDLNVDSIVQGREQGYNVFYGDTSNTKVLHDLGLMPRRTKAVVVALDNAAVAKRTVRAVKSVAPRAKIFARARNLAESKILLAEGVKEAFPETVESSFLLGQGVLANVGVSVNKIEKILSDMRMDHYAKLEGK